MIDYTFLRLEQICENKDLHKDKQLEIIKKYGRQAYATDFAILLGCCVDSKKTVIEDGLVKSFGGWWTSTIPLNYESYGHYVYSIGVDGDAGRSYWYYAGSIGGRPSTSFSQIKNYCLRPLRLDNGVLEVEYGEYPQTVVDKDFSIELENVFLSDTMKKTGKYYKMYAWRKTNDYVEYEYKGKKYIRIMGDTSRGYKQSIYNRGKSNVNIKEKVLSDGRVVKDNEVYWVSVEPIKWLIDRKNDIALSRDILFAGFQYGHEAPSIYDRGYNLPQDEKNTYYFNQTTMKNFLDGHFASDIVNSRASYIKNRIDEVEENPSIRKELLNFYYDNMYNELFIELNGLNKKDNLVLFMDIILDSDSYYEMNKKLSTLKKAIYVFGTGQKKQALSLIKDINSDKHKDVYKGKVVAYPTSSINKVEKPKRIIDRMLDLYFRIDCDSYKYVIDSCHENAWSIKDVCFRINCSKFRKDAKEKVKSLFTK